MSNQDISQYFQFGTGFPENEFFGDGGPIDSLLNFHNMFNHGGARSVVHSSIQNRPGLTRGRVSGFPPFLHHPIIDMNPMVFFGQQQPSQLEFPGRPMTFDPRPSPARPSPPVPRASGGGNRKRRASEKAILELKHMRLIDLKEDDDCCIICMEPFVDIKASTDEPKQEGALQMPCGHIFGSHCLKLWLKDHSTCPTCRKEVDFVEEDERGPMAANRRRLGGVDMRHVPGVPGRRMGREATVNRLVEVEVIVRQQRYAVPPPQQQMEPASVSTRVGVVGEAGWMAATASGVVAGPHVPPAPPANQISQYMSMVGGPFPSVRVEASMSRHELPSGLLVAPAQHATQRACGSHRPGLVNRANGASALYQSFVPANMPQRSQSHRHSLRQSQYQPYPEVHTAHHSSPINRDPMIGMYTSVSGVNNGGSSSGVQASGYPSSPTTNTTPDNPAQAPFSNQYGISQCQWNSGVRAQQQQNQNRDQTHMQVHTYQQQQRQQQQQQQQDLAQMQVYQQQQIAKIGPSSLFPLSHQVSGSRRTSATSATIQDQCDYTDVSMCQHQYGNINPAFNAGNIALLPPDQTQIIHLGCGHGFHRACLLSTMKSRTPRGEAQWLCGKCGRYENEVEGRQQQTNGQSREVIG